jgi:hypothetical protein
LPKAFAKSVGRIFVETLDRRGDVTPRDSAGLRGLRSPFGEGFVKLAKGRTKAFPASRERNIAGLVVRVVEPMEPGAVGATRR